MKVKLCFLLVVALHILFHSTVRASSSRDRQEIISESLDSNRTNIEERSKASEIKLQRSEQSINSYLNYLGMAALILAALVAVGFIVRERQRDN